jgi:hypothetical protein
MWFIQLTPPIRVELEQERGLLNRVQLHNAILHPEDRSRRSSETSVCYYNTWRHSSNDTDFSVAVMSIHRGCRSNPLIFTVKVSEVSQLKFGDFYDGYKIKFLREMQLTKYVLNNNRNLLSNAFPLILQNRRAWIWLLESTTFHLILKLISI